VLRLCTATEDCVTARWSFRDAPGRLLLLRGLCLSSVAGTGVSTNARRCRMQNERPGGQHGEGGGLTAHEDTAGEAQVAAEDSDGALSGEQARQVRFLEEEASRLRRRAAAAPNSDRVLEQRLAEASERIAQL